jgi:hypothetical protein
MDRLVRHWPFRGQDFGIGLLDRVGEKQQDPAGQQRPDARGLSTDLGIRIVDQPPAQSVDFAVELEVENGARDLVGKLEFPLPQEFVQYLAGPRGVYDLLCDRSLPNRP